MSWIGLVIGKIIGFLLSLTGRGSSLPGKLAMKFDGQLLSRFKFPKDVIVVTGTNGKTSTTHSIASIFKQAGYRVMTNSAGANMLQGVVTQSIKFSDLQFNVKADIVILEVDEGSLRQVLSQMNVSYLLLLNLFPDQEDRFGSVDQLAEEVSYAIRDDITLVVNADDPRLLKVASEHPHLEQIFYGLNTETLDQIYHSIACPICKESLNYSWHAYEHLGKVECSACGLSTPSCEYVGHDIDIKKQSFKLGNDSYTLPQANVYTLYNSLAAISITKEFDTKPDIINQVFESGEGVLGRHESFQMQGHSVQLNMAKNPAGMNQSLSEVVKDSQDSYQLLLAVNHRPADGISTDWLKDCAFEILKGTSLSKIYVTGEAKEELAGVLGVKGIPEDKIECFEDPKIALNRFVQDRNPTHILANYTALYEMYDDITRLSDSN